MSTPSLIPHTMSLFGNLCLSGAALLLLGLLNVAVLQKSPGGDAAVGHALAIFMLCGALLVCAALTTLAVGLRGGFERFGSSPGARALVGLAWFALATMGFYFFADPGTHLPRVVRVAGSFVLPVLMLAWAAVHLNDGLARAFPSGTATALTLAVAALASLPLAGMVVGSVVRSVGHVAQRGELDSFQQGIVRQIDATKAEDGIGSLLVHTPRGRHPVIRERALARIKSQPDWQEQMVRLLKTGAAPEVLGFLSANEVENPAVFAPAIHEGLVQQAQQIRMSIRNANHPSNLYEGMHFTEVRLALEVASAYQAKGTDVRAAVLEMKRAFDEPSPYDKPAFAAVGQMEGWLARHAR